MPLHIKKLVPALAVMTLVLAGCKTLPTKTGQAATAPVSAASGSQAPAATLAVSPVEFYLAQTQPGPGMMQVKLPDGSLYVQRQAVLTREDLTESAALVDKQGRNFVGLRFTEVGARKLTALSTQNVGKMLALVVDRQLVAAPKISEPLNRGVLAFGVGSAKEATELAARIRGERSGSAAPGAATPASAPARP